jgi:Cu/Ag efflux pump CusA
MLVFLPLFFLSGVEGRLLEPLGFAYVVSLAASLLVAITVTPVLSSLLLPGSKVVRDGREGALSRVLKAAYRPVLDATVHRWRLVTLVAAAGLAVAVVSLASAGRSFLPDFNEGSLTVSAVTLPGTALAESDGLGRMVEEILLAQQFPLAQRPAEPDGHRAASSRCGHSAPSPTGGDVTLCWLSPPQNTLRARSITAGG